MATRCRIAVKDCDIFKSIYCHFDGYPEYTGSTLEKFYNSKERANELIKLGGISCLLPDIEETRNNSYHVTNEEELNIKVHKSLRDLIEFFIQSDQDFLYLWDADRWKFVSKKNIYDKLYNIINEGENNGI